MRNYFWYIALCNNKIFSTLTYGKYGEVRLNQNDAFLSDLSWLFMPLYVLLNFTVKELRRGQKSWDFMNLMKTENLWNLLDLSQKLASHL